jgi:hypothetical protein
MKEQVHETIMNSDNVYIGVYLEEIHIPGITDAGARETNQFTITQHELCELAKYWMTRFLQSEWYNFYNPDAEDIATSRYAARRLVRIKQILGSRLYRKSTREAREHFFSPVRETAGAVDYFAEHQKIMKSI